MTSQLIDAENLDMLKGLLGDRFNELIETYLADSEARMNKLRTAICEGDLNAVMHQAHGLKGSSRNIGANSFADLCHTLESQARVELIEAEQQQLAALETSFAAVSEALSLYQ